MHLSSAIVAAASIVTGVSASSQNWLGFNSGATLPDRSAKFQADFEAEFKTAQALSGASGTFNAVRLYTNIQAYSTKDPIQAFQAAIDTKTYILLGIWCSGTDNIDNEIAALTTAVKQYGTALTDLVIGVSIGSEDLYRNSVTGQTNKAGVGADPKAIVGFIQDFQKAFANTALSKTSIGHVDTWDAWTNGTNKAVIDAIDWLGVDEYPFYETGKGNGISNAGSLFSSAFDATLGVSGGKPVWVTETGWPYTGPSWDQAVASVQNAETYWDEVGCQQLFNKVPTFWYNLRDSNPDNEVKFAISNNLSTTPRFNLTCPTTTKKSSTSSSSSSSATASSTGKSTATQTTLVSTASSTSGSGSGSSSESGASQTAGSPDAAVTTDTAAGASSINKLSGAAYAGVALIAGALFLF